MLRTLRVRAFTHVHRLPMADHDATRRGELTSRVTSDIETIARFAQYGGVAWIVDSVVIVGTLALMAVYAWQLALVTLLLAAPILPLFRVMQRRQLKAYEQVRSRVGETLSEVSEAVQGAAPIRAYGMQRRATRRLDDAIQRQFKAEMGAAKWFALMFPLGDLFGGLALAAVTMIGVWWGPEWGLNAGGLVACLFLVQLILGPIGELGEILDQTQTAIAGWSKVLDLLDTPITLVEPEAGRELPVGRTGDHRHRGRLHLPDRRSGAGRRRHRHPRRGERRHRRRDRLGQDHLRQAAVAPGRSVRRVGQRRRRAAARGRPGVAVGAHPHGAPGRLRVRRQPRREHRHGPRPAPPSTTCGARSTSWASASGWPACRVGSRPRWGSGARGSASASASSWLCCGPSSPTPACSCSTRRPARSTPAPSARSPRRCTAWPRGARRSASPTACRRPNRPTWSWSSTPAAWSSRAPTTSSSHSAAATPSSTGAGSGTPARWSTRPGRAGSASGGRRPVLGCRAMASEEYQAFQKAMAERPVPPPPANLQELRDRIDTNAGGLPLADGVTAEAVEIGGVGCIVCRPDGVTDDAPVLVYLHGGGFRMASALAYRSFGSHIAKAMGGRVVLVDYRLAPENPFPAAIDDTEAVYRGLLESGARPEQIAVAGDSAGGGLTASLALRTLANGPVPAALICSSPVTDLTAQRRELRHQRLDRQALVEDVGGRGGRAVPRRPRRHRPGRLTAVRLVGGRAAAAGPGRVRRDPPRRLPSPGRGGRSPPGSTSRCTSTTTCPTSGR